MTGKILFIQQSAGGRGPWRSDKKRWLPDQVRGGNEGGGSLIGYAVPGVDGYDPVSRLSSLAHDLASTANDLTLGFSYNPASQIKLRITVPVY